MNCCELTATVSTLANGIACKLSDDELAALSTVLVQLGDTLATIATHRTLCNNNLQKKNAVKNPKV